jgi:antitoxin component YwqK of YwqJK toxin-antitoxin module
MNIFNIYRQNKHSDDPYWIFDPARHFRPCLNKGDFFKLTGFDFGWFVLKPITAFIKDRQQETERGKCLSYAQKALYYWWYLDAQVTNGGFVQFYYNGFAHYVPTIIKGLEHIGDKKMAALVAKADRFYQKHKDRFEEEQENDLFESDLYDEFDGLSALDQAYYALNKKTMTLIEKYIRKHPGEICLDENGNEFDSKYSGECRTYYDSHTPKEIFTLLNGVVDGVFTSFYENGQTKEAIVYKNGDPTGERTEWFANGNTQYTVVHTGALAAHTWYYENGQPKKLEHRPPGTNERIGEYKEWFDNGQLAKAGTYLSNYERKGAWVEFYSNGNRKLEAEGKNGEFLMQNCWSEDGVQTLKDGTGLYVYEESIWAGRKDREEQEYKNYKRHGRQQSFTNGILRLYQEMKDGKTDGVTRTFYNNGTLKEETHYKNGQAVSSQKFPKFAHPKVALDIHSRVCTQCYEKEDHLLPPDNDPQLINKQILETALKANPSLFEPYDDDYVMGYSYTVRADEQGNVTNFKFWSASNGWLKGDIEQSLLQLKYEVALKDNQPVACIYAVQYNLYLTE